MFGDLTVASGGAPVTPFRTRREALLLAYLVLHHAVPVPRQRLAALLWPDSDRAGKWLTEAVCRVRRALGPHGCRIVGRTPAGLQFDPSGADIDVVAFDQALESGTVDGLARAVAAYRGPLLDGFDEPWLGPERLSRERAYVDALRRLAERRGFNGGHAEAEELLLRASAADPCNEGVHEALMRCQAAQGQIAAALGTYHAIRRRLREQDLPVSTSLGDLAAEVRAEAGRAQPRAARPDAPDTRLPSPLTPLIGREGELGRMVEQVRANRLVTLAGPGGVGKTRLAIAAAQRLATEVLDGAAMVELGAIADPALVTQEIALGLSVREETDRDLLHALCSRLANLSLLLVLDNCEHLSARCAEIADVLLARCRGLRILATSRRPLGLPGEVVWRVPPLEVPRLSDAGSGSTVSLDPVRDSPAVRLFVARARAAHADFSLTEANARAVTEICHHLDGIPLAVELAAARVRAMPVDHLAATVRERPVVVATDASASGRHRDLDTVIRWSYELLGKPQQEAFRRLAAFSGGWTLENGRDVCGGAPSAFPDILASLVDQSLVLYDDAAAEARFHFLQTIRSFALARLDEDREADMIRDRHLGVFLRLALHAADRLQGREQFAWFRRLETEHDNLRAALAHSLADASRLRDGLRLAEAMRTFWDIRGFLGEGQAYYERAVALARRAGDTDAEAEALCGFGALSMAQGDSRARALLEAGLAILRRTGSERERLAAPLFYLARVADSQGDHAAARRYVSEAIRAYRARGVPSETAAALNLLGRIAHSQGACEEAVRAHERALRLARASGDERSLAVTLLHLGRARLALGQMVAGESLMDDGLEILQHAGSARDLAVWLNIRGDMARARHDFGEAARHYDGALASFAQQGNRRGVAWSVEKLGLAAHDRRDHAQSLDLLRQALRIRGELHDLLGIAESLDLIARVSLLYDASDRALAERCARMAGAACAIREIIRAPLPMRLDHALEPCAGAFPATDDADMQAAFRDGRAMTVEEAVGLGLQTA